VRGRSHFIPNKKKIPLETKTPVTILTTGQARPVISLRDSSSGVGRRGFFNDGDVPLFRGTGLGGVISKPPLRALSATPSGRPTNIHSSTFLSIPLAHEGGRGVGTRCIQWHKGPIPPNPPSPAFPYKLGGRKKKAGCGAIRPTRGLLTRKHSQKFFSSKSHHSSPSPTHALSQPDKRPLP